MASASLPGGYHGHYLWIDLTTTRVERPSIDPQRLRQFLGGTGLATYLLLLHRGDQTEPTHPDAPLVFAFSPLVGSPLTTSAKFVVASRSPLTGFLNDSLVSSGFALAGKRVGVDALVVTGRCSQPSFLVVDDGRIDLLPAEQAWGLECQAAESLCLDTLRSRYRPVATSAANHEFQVAVIGPAGEKLVRYATISHQGRHAGRGGNGAVMGAKRLKAIAVRGTHRVAWSDTPALLAAAKDLSQRSLGPATAKYREVGTAANLLVLNRLHALPTRNFQQSSFEEVAPLDPLVLHETHHHTRTSCVACTIGCEHMYQPKAESAVPTGPVRLEYESLFALGPLCGIADPSTVMQAAQRCDALGLDTISTGGTVAFAMECVERGWWSVPWLRFADSAALLQAIELIGQATEVGIALGWGSKALATSLGPQAEAIAPHVKGLEIPGYDPRAAQAMALGFAVGTRGADHNRSGAYQVDFSDRIDRYHLQPQQVPLAIETEDQAALLDSLIFCKFLRGVFTDFYQEAAQYLQSITGWCVTPSEMHLTAERIVTLKKLFNIRAGWQPSDDRLPERMLRESPSNDSAARLTAEHLQTLIATYNQQRGWSAQGWVSLAAARRLDLEAWHVPTSHNA